MLVMSRREEEKIVFPQFSTTVKILSAKPGRVSIGIDAPKEVRILREEIADCRQLAQMLPQTIADLSALREFRHALQNRVTSITKRLAAIQSQYRTGDFDTLGESLDQFESDLGSVLEMINSWGAGPLKGERCGANTASSNAKRGRRVMVVEDDDNECTLLAGFLRQAGHHVMTANDGADALELLNRCEPPDVVLMDMMLPRLGGAATIDRIRANPELTGLQIFVVSGQSPSDFAKEGRRPPAVDGWLPKPLDPEALLASISPWAGTAA